MKNLIEKTNDGWYIFKVVTPNGESFRLSFKEDTLRIRKAGWIPVELVGLQIGESEIEILEDYEYKDLSNKLF